MADKIVKIYGDARFLPRHDTLENWQTKNPILLEAEPSYVIDGEDGKKIKFGDGVTHWNDLPYLSSSVEVDQTYTPNSENAQSGKAVAEAKDLIIDKIIDPDNNPLSESTETIVNFVMETGALDSTGADTENPKQIRSDFISLSSSSGAIYASTEWNEDLRIIGYDENKAFVEKIYASVGSEFSIPEIWAYLRFYTGATDAQFTFVYGTPETKAEFKKVYIRDHGYYLKGENISEPDSHKFVIQTSGLDGNPYNVTEIRAPSSDPKEATLCLTNWGNGVNQMVDISSMVYDPENPTMEIVCQARNGSPLPKFSVRYNDGSGAGRVKKFVVHPDAIPIELTAQGLKVRKNNNFNNTGTDEEYIIVNLGGVLDRLDSVEQSVERLASAVRNTLSGSTVSANDVSPVEHALDVRVRSKNLYYNSTHTFNASDMQVGTYYVFIRDSSAEMRELLCSLAGQTVSFSYMCEPFDLWSGKCQVVIFYDDTYIEFNDKNSNTIPANFKDCEFIGVDFRYRSKTQPTDVAIENIKISNVQLELGTTATEYTPYVSDLSAVNVSRYGKNLLNINCEESVPNNTEQMGTNLRKFVNGTYIIGMTRNNIYLPKVVTAEFANNELTITATSEYHGVGFPLKLQPNTNYTISCETDDVTKMSIGVGFYDDNGKYLSDVSAWNDNTKSFTTDSYGNVLIVLCPTVKNQPITFSNIQLEVGKAVTEYEEYKGVQTVVANTDGTVEGLTSISPNMTVTTDTEGVVIDMTYNADTKMYIDNKLAEISTAIVNNV